MVWLIKLYHSLTLEIQWHCAGFCSVELYFHSLTHWGRDKVATTSQTIFWNAFSWMKMCEFFRKIPLKFVPMGPINNIRALVQIMAWRRPGDKPLSEPMLVFLPTHTCVTRPQWVNNWINCKGNMHKPVVSAVPSMVYCCIHVCVRTTLEGLYILILFINI